MAAMKFLALLALVAGALGASSCNTMIGIGRDMKIGGEGLENAANKVTGGGGGSSSADSSGAPIY